jgi:hypothetical protein
MADDLLAGESVGTVRQALVEGPQHSFVYRHVAKSTVEPLGSVD